VESGKEQSARVQSSVAVRKGKMQELKIKHCVLKISVADKGGIPAGWAARTATQPSLPPKEFKVSAAHESGSGIAVTWP